MISLDQIRTLNGRDVHGPDGDRIGTVGQVWNDSVGRPAWAGVRTGLFGLNESLVPLENADVHGGKLVVPFSKATVKDAPNVDADHDEPLARDDVERLSQYYGLNWRDSHPAHRIDRDTHLRGDRDTDFGGGALTGSRERHEAGRRTFS